MKFLNISGAKLRILLHILVWAVLFILPTWLFGEDNLRSRVFILQIWFQIACYAAIFYTSYFFLIHRYFFTGRKVRYFLLVGTQIMVFMVFLWMLVAHFEPVFRPDRIPGSPLPEENTGQIDPQRAPPPGPKHPSPVRNMPLFDFLLTSCLITGLSLGLRFSEKMILNEKLRKEADREKLNVELKLLKHQINPHFLFNTLNSIYSLALMKSDMTAEEVMKLSEMMRYVLQDVSGEKVPLELELEYIRHFVELQKIRLNDNVEVQFRVAGEPGLFEIPPIILVPFIENAFKFGSSAHESARIGIDIRTEGAVLKMLVTNRIFPGRTAGPAFGIGIANTRKRLEMIYPGRHELDIEKNEGHFIVNLSVNLV